MRIVHAESGAKIRGGSVVALGDFDGLHLAHMAIIRSGIRYAQEQGLQSGILLFENNSKGTKLITPNRIKMELLEREQPDFVYLQKFTKDFMRLSPREFVELLVQCLEVRAVCVGYDYSFGYKAEGDVAMLKKFSAEYGFEVLVTDAVQLDGQLVSSTNIRRMLETGEIREANHFLGRPFCIEGTVLSGLQNGRKMGIPTANVQYDAQMVLPGNGVYAGITETDGRRLQSVVNVGMNPTFGAEVVTIESHILDFNEDLYGKQIRVFFEQRLRGDIKFNSMEALKAQIMRDIEQTRAMKLV